MSVCIRCGDQWEPDPALTLRLGKQPKVCPLCVLTAIDDMAAEADAAEIAAMTDAEVEAELREGGIDVEAFKARMTKLVDECIRKRGPGGGA